MDDDFLRINLDDDWIRAEFCVACHKAVANMQTEFHFKGYVVNTSDAINVVNLIQEKIVLH